MAEVESSAPVAPAATSVAPTTVQMPESAIAAATQALNDALEAANITTDETTETVEKVDGAVKTVFDSPTKFNVKHPLYSPWTLWFESQQSKNLPKPAPAPGSAPSTPAPAGGGWMDNVRPVVSFNSVEEFWGLYNNIVPPSLLPQKANYYLFKESIIPAWEDEANKHGGKWSFQMPKDKTRAGVDQMWMYTMLAAIGETFETPMPEQENADPLPSTSDLITGVIFSTRNSFYRISIWTRFAPGPDADPATDEILKRIVAIGKHFKTSVLGFNEEDSLLGGFQTEVEFISHADSEKKDKKSVRKIFA
ncbi:Translation initiation factor 4F, cap-binding subunit (eIF-4E) and related cap-binding proteins [Phaffia rhodozyma]|uniref:Eukaryotic translation initiation factor 4E n=1 Tax=Phaffia rhodozyma TaxID=264483 RepID=A0A0F7SI21_PHARH|nr:Translation initiation factor 4F, cap-binding subunit (eIF-4E) and related cap-binding proteins [Phaffia rhodozyma]